jgi:hypothetical protein
MHITQRSSLALIVFAASLAACSTDTGPEESTGTSDALVGSVLADTTEVHEDSLVFAKGAVPAAIREKLAKGTEKVILMADRQKDATDESGQLREDVANPYGFLRRAISIEDTDEKTIIKTEPASLDEAFEQINAGTIVQVGTEDPTAPTPYIGGVLRKTIPVINLDGKTLYSAGGLTVRLRTGHVNLDTSLDLAADVGFFQLKDAHVILDATLKSELVVETTLSRGIDKTFEQEVFHASWPVGSVGPVPVTLGLVAKVGCQVSARGTGTASAGVGLDINVHGGVQYRDGQGLSAVTSAPRVTPRVIAPHVGVSGDAATRCYVLPQLSLKLFDAAGPTLTPQLAAKLSATYPARKATLTGEVALDVGGEMRIFGQQLGSVNYRVANYEKVLWSHNF